ncbi:hypothetical protein [Thorsellia anophelis]|uniref:Uncharacterized protein n=1 Tax=Thorsellia anophelis DSM 18579 TaxID=1123402 RepID=A0A1I0D526_9GAMM|nr:hypothetical protein [Thorsellia anophelis]SET27251.1 hypothetical protein SAMN02583745_01849 [Thorsellia anophelis DSM 18579]
MNNIVKALPLALITLTFSAFSNVEGTYAGHNKARIHLWSYKDSDIYQYQLVFTDAYGQQPNAFQAPSAAEITFGKTYTFKQNGSRYDDTQPSQCIIKATFDEGILTIDTQNGCNDYTGQYSFSTKASYIPEEYRGTWSKEPDCNTVAIIDETWFAVDADYGSAFVVDVVDGNDQSHNIVGLEYYEDFYGSAAINIKRIDDKLYIKGEHHAIPYDDIFSRCNKKSF